MTKIIALTAEPRDRAGKGNARQTRRDGRIPGVIYGDKKNPSLIALDSNALFLTLRQPGFFTRLMDVTVNGATERCLARDVQLDPVTDRPLHVDFLRVNPSTKITIEVPVEFINHDKSQGLKEGGVLNVVHHALSLLCSVTNIPEKITVDLTGKNIGDSIHLEDISLPSGVSSAGREKDYTVATIAAPTKAEEEAPKPTAEAAAGTPATGTAAPAPGAAPAVPAKGGS